jgi:hypothetical protein
VILKETLKAIIKAQKSDIESSEYGIKRALTKKIDLNVPFAIIVTGIRRCGKSTLLRQVMKAEGGLYYFNFEDPRANGFELSDFEKLDEIFVESCGEKDCYFFDEIQNI